MDLRIYFLGCSRDELPIVELGHLFPGASLIITCLCVLECLMMTLDSSAVLNRALILFTSHPVGKRAV